ncbi:hypothetical protein GQ600_5389 [Phytophthora cactorum]|nr:hypothetical protein GQ600_5389 [Phytophthora cactorum]
MTARLQRVATLLLVCAACRAPQVVASVSASSLQGPSAVPVSPLSVPVAVWSVGSVATGCSQCRDSGNCSVAMNDTSSVAEAEVEDTVKKAVEEAASEEIVVVTVPVDVVQK